MIILGIETSCDETAAAVLAVADGRAQLKSNVVASQVDMHRQWGGVVPEMAAREHALTIVPTVDEALRRAGITGSDLDAIAVTAGPGLVPALAVGTETAQALALAWGKPLVAVNHLEGHIYANWITTGDGQFALPEIALPALALIVSGGHTELLVMADHGQYELLGKTRDDAAGEAFDKTAKLLGLGYPGGPAISKMALEGQPDAVRFTPPMLKSDDYDFSFSGLKTAVRVHVADQGSVPLNVADIARAVERAIVTVLVDKTVRAAIEHGVQTVMLAGGVAANKPLRAKLREALSAQAPQITYLEPALAYTTDNAAMIAMAGYFRTRSGMPERAAVKIRPNWELYGS